MSTAYLSTSRAQGCKQVAVRLWNQYMPQFLQIEERTDARLYSDLVDMDGWDISHRCAGTLLLVGVVGRLPFIRRGHVSRGDGRTLPEDNLPGLRETWWMLRDELADRWAWLRKSCAGLPALLLELAWRSLLAAMCLLLVLMVARLIAVLRGQ